jgi:plasmid stabilization system protein ParE
VAQVVYSAAAFEKLEHVSDAVHTAVIESAIESLDAHPLVGRRVDDDIRELVISLGATGYIALYRFLVQRDEVRVLALRHQREIAITFTIQRANDSHAADCRAGIAAAATSSTRHR